MARLLCFSIVIVCLQCSPTQANGLTCTTSTEEGQRAVACTTSGTGTQSLADAVRSAAGQRTSEPVGYLKINAEGNVTIRKNDLDDIRRLHIITIKAKPGVENAQLITDEDVFNNLPHFRVFEAERIQFAPSTITAFGSMHDKLTQLKLDNCTPSFVLLDSELPKFTKLWKVELRNMMRAGVAHPMMLDKMLQKSASSIETLSVSGIWYPTIRGVVRGMNKLEKFEWQNGNVTQIAQGAFNDLVNVQEIDLSMNQIRALPEGLFSNNRKLKRVNLKGNQVTNLSRANFTHCPNFEVLDL